LHLYRDPNPSLEVHEALLSSLGVQIYFFTLFISLSPLQKEEFSKTAFGAQNLYECLSLNITCWDTHTVTIKIIFKVLII
jgi:hypothetical protein